MIRDVKYLNDSIPKDILELSMKSGENRASESLIKEIRELKKREPRKCDNDKDTLKIKKEVVDDMGLFINYMMGF